MTTIIKQHRISTGVTNDVTLSLPLGAQIVNVHEAPSTMIGLWVRQDDDEPSEVRHFIVTADDQEAPKHALYIGTAWFGTAVRHVFDGATK